MDETTATDAAAATTTSTPDAPTPQPPVLRVVKGDATPEEVAALVAVFAALRTVEAAPPRRPAPAWGGHHRKVRRTLPHGLGGWRASSLPR